MYLVDTLVIDHRVRDQDELVVSVIGRRNRLSGTTEIFGTYCIQCPHHSFAAGDSTCQSGSTAHPERITGSSAWTPAALHRSSRPARVCARSPPASPHGKSTQGWSHGVDRGIVHRGYGAVGARTTEQAKRAAVPGASRTSPDLNDPAIVRVARSVPSAAACKLRMCGPTRKRTGTPAGWS